MCRCMEITPYSGLLLVDEGEIYAGGAKFRTVLLELKAQGKTILLASHNREDIRVLCDEVYEMEHGKLKQGELL